MIGVLLKNYLNLKNPKPNISKMYIKFNNLFFPIKNLTPQNHLKIIKKRDIEKMSMDPPIETVNEAPSPTPKTQFKDAVKKVSDVIKITGTTFKDKADDILNFK